MACLAGACLCCCAEGASAPLLLRERLPLTGGVCALQRSAATKHRATHFSLTQAGSFFSGFSTVHAMCMASACRLGIPFAAHDP